MLKLISLVVLFFVLFDPPASLVVFQTQTQDAEESERRRIAMAALMLAALLSFGTLLFGGLLLPVLNTNLADFRVAGGILLAILGIKMALGLPLHNSQDKSALASLIATPLLTGPAVMTAIIVLRTDFGLMPVAYALGIVLLITAALFLLASHLRMARKPVQILSTFLGLIIIAWGVGFLRIGLGI